MTSFNILDPTTSIDQNLILEASAGCGKTFTIEHLTARLVSQGIKLEEVVIVTFTKKGASDLKERILANLKKEIEKGSLSKKLVDFDAATITTLHGFALKIVQEDPLGAGHLFQNLLTDEQSSEFIYDFLRSLTDIMSVDEAALLLKSEKISHLKEKLKKGQLTNFPEVQASFTSYYSQVKKDHNYFDYDDLLIALSHMIEKPLILKRLRQRFKIAIIDEFQDTDNLQWHIFSKLFLHEEGRLYLVGDPKQSIYSFRNADIYTYLEAQKTLGKESERSLFINYRSDPGLIKELNQLFRLPQEASFLPLPKLSAFLPVPEVLAPSDKIDSPPLGKWNKLQFFSSKKGLPHFLNFIAARLQEFKKLGVPYESMAILVDTNKLGYEVHDYLKEHKIPSMLLRDQERDESEIKRALFQVKEACLNPQNDSKLISALVTPFFSFSVDDLKQLDDLVFKELVVWKFLQLQESLEKSSACFIGQLFEMTISQHSVKENLLRQPEGECWIEELNHDESEESITEPGLAIKGAVQILTLHVSKGLEFEVVFALGLSLFRQKKDQENLDEILAEKLRLFYVAVTRAKRALFIPLNFAKRKSNYELPLTELFFSKATSEFSQEALSQLGLSIVETMGQEVIEEESVVRQDLVKPPEFVAEIPTLSMLSFTQLKSKIPYTQAAIDYDPTELPPGADTGVMVHHLLEKIPLSLAKIAETPSDYATFVLQSLSLLGPGAISQWEMWLEKICEILFEVFNTPLFDQNFCLKEVEEENSFREVEFLHKNPSGYMKGVIDWIFEFDKKIYIVDWKTNWLGDYSDETLKKVMHDEDYNLQAMIYQEAALRYLKRFSTYKIEGVYFFFVRGGALWKAI